jgi:hypothetical protein
MKDGGAKVPTFGSIFYGTEDSSTTLYHFDLVKSNAEKNYYLVTTENKASSKVIQNFFIEFNIFEDFREFYSSIIFITTKHQISSYKDVYCSCKYFAKNKKCNYVFNFLASNNLIPIIELNVLNIKKLRGRPKKNQKRSCTSKGTYLINKIKINLFV